MRQTTLEQFVRDPKGFVELSQRECVLVTRDGEPLALLVGLQYKDREDLRLEASPEFWRMIEERRREPTVRLRDVEAELFAGEK